MQTYVVVNNPSDFRLKIPGVEVLSARAYLSDLELAKKTRVKVYNLCRSYGYQKAGYYVSLLAAARKHKALPDITTIQDLKTSSIVKLRSGDLEKIIGDTLKDESSKEISLDFYFGRNEHHQYDALGTQLFSIFQVPLVRVNLVKTSDTWLIHSITLLSIDDITGPDRQFFETVAQGYFEERLAQSRKKSGYHLAILYDPQEKEPPSNPEALQKFIEAAREKGIEAQLITRKDFSRLADFDALFIRETTNVNHHTYRFARKAKVEGLVVVDDPESIMKCSNKVYLAELLRCNGVPMPETFIITKDNQDEIPLHLDFPLILKQPDSAFSVGVEKVKSLEEYNEIITNLLQKSDMVIAQAFMPTDYDWRIGVFDGKPVYACKYYMAKGHWQIYNWERENKNNEQSGDFETLRIEEVPHAVMAAALSATRLIGRGLYGVDLKEINGYPYVIEVNDNPNLDAGIEDKVLGDKLYTRIIDVFYQRITRLRAKSRPAGIL